MSRHCWVPGNRIFRLIAGFAPVVLLLVLGAVNVAAQTTVATLEGSVMDESEAVIPGATVSMVHTGTNDTRTTTTNELGNYQFPQLPVGRYELTVEASGFQTHILQEIGLQVNARRREDVRLQVGQVTEQVTVEAMALTVNTTNPAIGEVIDQKPIVDLPLNGRNFLQLAQLTPGTIPPVLQNGEDTTSSFNGRRANLSVGISGTRQVSGAYLFDGVLGREEFYGAVAVQPVLEGIAEFKIMRGYFSPEFAAPAVVSVVSKSGTNEWHGAAWEFLRNDALDARNTFDLTGSKPAFRQNQFGGSVGGPIVRDKLFVMANTEVLRVRQSFSQNLLVPTSSMLGGDLSGFGTIYDPASANAQKIKDPFSNNMIPQTRIANFSAIYNDFILTSSTSPLDPTVQQTGINFLGVQRVVQDTDKFDTRWDYIMSEKNRIFGRFTSDITDQTDENPKRGASRVYPLHSYNGVLSFSRIFSPTFINDVRVGFSRSYLHAGGPVQGENPNWPAFFGLSNISTSEKCSGVPIARLQEFGGWGFPSGSCLNVLNQNLTIFDNASYVAGRHSISFGGSLERVNLRHEVAFGPQGTFSFTKQFTEGFDGADPIANTGHVIADYLLGWPIQGTGQAKVSPTYRRGWWWAFYINDDVKVSNRFTLNLGMRYQIQEPLIEKFDNISDFDYPTGQQRFAGVDGVPRGMYDTDLNDFAPRIGFAWRPFGESTSIRASYGVFYDRLPGNDQAWQGISPPLNIGQAFNTPDQIVPTVNIDTLFPKPDLSGGLPDGGFLFNLGARRNPYLQQWTFSIQRNLPWDLFWEIAYVGSKGAKLSKRYDRNVGSPPEPGDTRSAQERRPYPNLAFILSDEGAGMSKYHALQTSLRKSYSSGITFMLNYLWGRSMDTDSYDGKATRFYFPGSNDYGRSIFDVRQRLVFSLNYDLPFGSDASGFKKHLIGGWAINGITALQTGLPFHAYASDRSNAAITFGGRPDRVCNGNLPSDQRTREVWLDTSCFVPPGLNRIGNAGVHYLDTDGNKTQDVGISKNFEFTETMRVQFRFEAFNLFNNTNLNRPATNASAPATFGRIFAAQRARVMQFGLKFYF